VVERVFVAGLHVLRIQAQALGEAGDEGLRVFARVAVHLALVGEQRGVVPARLAVGAPADRQRPARQLLARVPLALAVVQEAAAAVVVAQAQRQLLGAHALGGAERIGVPFGAV